MSKLNNQFQIDEDIETNSINKNNAYFSDDEDYNNDEKNEYDDNYDDESEEEFDEETRKMIFQKSMDRIDSIHSIDDYEGIKKDKIRKKTTKINKTNNMNLDDFLKHINEKKTKKFISKRVIGKKIDDGIIVSKRCFNPRFPPYMIAFNSVEKNEKILDLKSYEDFPSLGK